MRYLSGKIHPLSGQAYGLKPYPSTFTVPSLPSGEQCHYCKGHFMSNPAQVTGPWRNILLQRMCDVCCAEVALEELLSCKVGDRVTGYLTVSEVNGRNEVLISVGTLYIRTLNVRTSRSGFGSGKRTDTWFRLTDSTNRSYQFHAFQMGDNNDIAHIRRVKGVR